jgi:hypothetical protein
MEFETTMAKRAGGVSRVDHTHVTVPTRFVERDGIRFAYRRLGQESGMPLLFFQHFRGGMDHWDPAVTDGFAQDRPVVLFDNAGVAGTTGDTPNTIEAMADHAVAFVGALFENADQIAGWATCFGKKITGVCITHGHSDHWLGLARLLQHFPEARG